MNLVEPNLKEYADLKELLESEESILYFEPNISRDELLERKLVFVVSEPGHGKTRLLKETLISNSESGIFLDLKKIGKVDIHRYINSNDFKKIGLTNQYTEEIHESSQFVTGKFDPSNIEKSVFCFDALDEVKNEDFADIVENINNFVKKNKNTTFFISCRKNYLERWQHLFSDFNFSYVEIFPLSVEKVKDFLGSSGLQPQDIEQLLQKMNFNHRQRVIQVPRYLEMIAKIAESEGIEKIQKVNRGDLFEKFIYQKLKVEHKKITNTNTGEIVKKVLEKLALVMEIFQTNEITKGELMEFFDDTNSNLNVSFLNQTRIDFFYDRSLLRDNIESIEFENTEFQEYLAAKEIQCLGRVDQVVFDLCLIKEKGWIEVHPSWINTLTFLIEMDIQILVKLFDYIFSKDQHSVHIGNFINLLPRDNLEKLSTSDRRRIFRLVYSYYQDAGHWIDYDIADALSFYYDSSLYEYIKNPIRDRKIRGDLKLIAKANSSTVIAFLMERGLLTPAEKDDCVKRIKKFLNKEKHQVVLRRSLFALGKFKDIKLFTPPLIKKIFHTSEDTVISNLIYALEEINPNAPISYKTFLKGIKINNISCRYSLYKVNKKAPIKKILNEFINDEDLLSQFLEHESIYQDDDIDFVNNIEVNLDPYIIRQLKKIISKAFSGQHWYRARSSRFLRKIIFLIEKNSENFIFELIENSEDGHTLYALEDVFVMLLKKEDVNKFIEKIKKVDNKSTWIAEQTLLRMRLSGRSDGEAMYKYGRQFFPETYKKADLQQEIHREQEERRETENYYAFQNLLNASDEKTWYPAILEKYIQNKEEINKFITTDEKSKLIRLTKKFVFSKFDPGEQKLRIDRRENGSTTYTTDKYIFLFGFALLVADELGTNDISEYRQKILNYIPFAYDNHRRAIFSLVPDPTNFELKEVIRLYENRQDDLKIHMPISFIEFCEKYNLTDGKELLKEFVMSNRIRFYERRSALETLEKLESDERYFQSIFSKYTESKEDDKTLSDIANGILIQKFGNEDAIKWRVNQLLDRAFPFQRPKGGHSVGPQEHELDSKDFAQPLLHLKNTKYKKYFLDLLESSFDIFNEGENYSSYSSYLWSIVIEYFKGLKEMTKSYAVLDDLEKFIIKKNNIDGINWFRYQYQQLKLDYVVYLGKPANISDCIKKYNSYKESQYLDIATPRDLFELVKKIIASDLNNWWNSKGGKDFVKKHGKPAGGKVRQDEDLIQKMILPHFEVALRDAGLRGEGIHVPREAQLYNSKRTDLLISYGFIGPILIEFKLFSNPEGQYDKEKGQKYKNKLKSYIKGTNSHFGIFLLFELEDVNIKEKYLSGLQELYASENNIQIMAL